MHKIPRYSRRSIYGNKGENFHDPPWKIKNTCPNKNLMSVCARFNDSFLRHCKRAMAAVRIMYTKSSITSKKILETDESDWFMFDFSLNSVWTNLLTKKKRIPNKTDSLALCKHVCVTNLARGKFMTNLCSPRFNRKGSIYSIFVSHYLESVSGGILGSFKNCWNLPFVTEHALMFLTAIFYFFYLAHFWQFLEEM